MRSIRLSMVAILLLGIGTLVSSATGEGDAIITLGVLPLPPDCVQNPGGTATIEWSIQYQTVPDYVTFTLYDPTHSIVYDSATYPGSTGIAVTRTWTVPSPLPQGFYWVRVEYYSVGIGLEAWAETGFLICEPTGRVCLQKLSDADCDGVLSGGDTPVEGWTVGLITPAGSTVTQPTGPDGWACWDNLPYGDYTAFEIVQPGWTALLPDSVEITVGAAQVDVVFLNQSHDLCWKVCCLDHTCIITTQIECQRLSGYWHPEWVTCEPNPCDIYTPTEGSSWGQIKTLYR